MVERRWHKKSRNGCDQCKQRRVKCDETRPICRGCIRRSSECSYAQDSNSTPKPTLHQPPVKQSSQPHQTPRLSISSSSATNYASPDDPNTPSIAAASPLSAAPSNHSVNHVPSYAVEMEIMHHFTIRTWQTCDAATFPSSFWQESMPLLAMKHDYLLFALMSFTSLHMAFLRLRSDPEDTNGEAARYTSLALNYRDRTLKILPTLFENPSRNQAEACFWASALIGLIGLATFTTPAARQSSAKAQLLQVCQLWRGTATIGAVYAPVVGEGYAESFNPIPDGVPVGTREIMTVPVEESTIHLPTLHPGDDDHFHGIPSPNPRGVAAAVVAAARSESDELPIISPIGGTPVANGFSPSSASDLDLHFEAKILQLRQLIVSTALPHAKLTPLLTAIDDFSRALVLYKTAGSESGIMAWGPRQSPQFIEDFQRGDLNASLIVIFYGVGLHLVRHVWYVSDLGAKLVAELIPLFEQDLNLAAAAADGGSFGNHGINAVELPLQPKVEDGIENMDLDGVTADHDGVTISGGDRMVSDGNGTANSSISGASSGSVKGTGVNEEAFSRAREKAALIRWAMEQIAS